MSGMISGVAVLAMTKNKINFRFRQERGREDSRMMMPKCVCETEGRAYKRSAAVPAASVGGVSRRDMDAKFSRDGAATRRRGRLRYTCALICVHRWSIPWLKIRICLLFSSESRNSERFLLQSVEGMLLFSKLNYDL